LVFLPSGFHKLNGYNTVWRATPALAVIWLWFSPRLRSLKISLWSVIYMTLLEFIHRYIAV